MSVLEITAYRSKWYGAQEINLVTLLVFFSKLEAVYK